MRILLLITLLMSCQKAFDPTKEIWIYTSMYKDTVADLSTELQKDFPGITFHWYQAGSEEIAARANGEIMAGGIRADLLISSDRFWYEELAGAKMLHHYRPTGFEEVDEKLKHKDGFYTAVALPMMVMTYNKEVVSQPPKTFREMTDKKWDKQFTTGSPLASGTNFTTMAMLQKHYGWEYFTKLKNNGVISQGGNSAVIRRVQTKERPVGWVLLEDLLRLQGKDDRLGIIYPEDGVVLQANVMAIAKRPYSRTLAEKVADWLLSKKGQEAMLRSYMYATRQGFLPPKGAPELKTLKMFPSDQAFLDAVTEKRIDLKDEYTEIMFQ